MRPRALTLIALAALSGCGGGPAPLASASAARLALQASLDAWKGGKPPSSLATEKPPVEAVDFEWKAGKVLTGFAIHDVSPGQGIQTFSASITIRGEPAAKDVKSMVLGLDPVRIYRDEDYHRAMNMDNAPSPVRKRR